MKDRFAGRTDEGTADRCCSRMAATSIKIVHKRTKPFKCAPLSDIPGHADGSVQAPPV